MTDHTDKGLQLGNFVIDDNNQERQSWKCFGQTCNRSLVVFLSQFFVILLILACCIVRIKLAETCEEITVWIANFVEYSWIYFTFSKIMNKIISTKERVFISLVGPSGSGKSQLIHDWLVFGTFQPEFDKIYYFYQHLQSLYGLMSKKNIEFVQGVDFELIQNLPNNGTKFLLIFDDSCEEISSSKEFVKIATVGRHKGLSTVYIKHNLFHQSRLGRDIELQKTHIVSFKSPRDVLQINTLSQQLGLGSQLKDWYTTATSVPYGHLLIDLTPKTVDSLRYCTNSGSTPSLVFLPQSSNRLHF